MAIQITPVGEVIVRCPYGIKTSQISCFVQEKSHWIRKYLQRIPAPEPQLSDEELNTLKKQAAVRIPERVRYFAEKMGVAYGRITIRSQKTLWGSCSGAGNLNFNCLLMLTPPEVQDYIVVHELCHRLEMNHSARFWAEVEKVLPDYRTRRQWLKEQGDRLICRLPGVQK